MTKRVRKNDGFKSICGSEWNVQSKAKEREFWVVPLLGSKASWRGNLVKYTIANNSCFGNNRNSRGKQSQPVNAYSVSHLRLQLKTRMEFCPLEKAKFQTFDCINLNLSFRLMMIKKGEENKKNDAICQRNPWRNVFVRCLMSIVFQCIAVDARDRRT